MEQRGSPREALNRRKVHPSFSVRFLLSTNLSSSVTRITADTANAFVKRGIPATVMFPAVDWLDYKLFLISRGGFFNRSKEILRLGLEILTHIPFRRRWCGFKFHEVDPRVRGERFLLIPSAVNWPKGEVVVVHPPYLLPHLLRTIPDGGIKLVVAVHVNLQKAMSSPSPPVSAWYRHWVAQERLVSVVRYTTSEDSRKAAEELGIPIREVIPNGIDLSLFQPARPPATGSPLVVSLYCDPHPQKGRAAGVEALKRLKSRSGLIRLCSIGRVTAEQSRIFDHNYGYLHGQTYAKALQESDIFVYPSLYDGFPAPPLQAMACGAALVTTSVEGVTQYAVDEENCLLSTPGDSQMMSVQILRLTQDQVLRERLRANGVKTAQGYSIERSAALLLEFLQEVYSEPGYIDSSHPLRENGDVKMQPPSGDDVFEVTR